MKPFVIEITWLTGIDTGWGNGYVAIPEGHKLFGAHYDDIDVEIHGGLTYSDIIGDSFIERGCPEELRGMWAVGFDTAHAGDTKKEWTKENVQKEADRLLEKLLIF